MCLKSSIPMSGGRKEIYNYSTVKDIKQKMKIKDFNSHYPRTTECCSTLNKVLAEKNYPLSYSPRFREYSLSMYFSSTIANILACPWCGKILPHSLREEYVEILENLNPEEDIDFLFDVEKLPAEFQSDEWWKKRGL